MRLHTRLASLTCALLAPLAPLSVANAQTYQVYTNSFEAALDQPPWGTAAHLNWASNFSTFVGQFSNNGTILMLPSPTLGAGQSAQYTLTFDLYTIDKWEGTAGNDYFGLLMNGNVMFYESFATNGTAQSFRAPNVGPANLGFNSSYNDAIYRDISVPFTVSSVPHVWISWYSSGINPSVSEASWGVDNVRVSYTVVPAPGTAGLALAAGLSCLRRKRRSC